MCESMKVIDSRCENRIVIENLPPNHFLHRLSYNSQLVKAVGKQTLRCLTFFDVSSELVLDHFFSNHPLLVKRVDERKNNILCLFEN